MKALKPTGAHCFISITNRLDESCASAALLAQPLRRTQRASCPVSPTPPTVGLGGGFARPCAFGSVSGAFYIARDPRFVQVATATRYRYPGDSMKRPRFPRMSFASGLAAFAMLVLSGCAAGGDGSAADWVPVARQTTGRYQRVCTLPINTTVQGQAVTQPLGQVAAALAPASPAFDLRADDKTLSISLARWASMTGVAMRWMTPLQVPITSDSRVAGDLPTAMKSIFAAVTEAGYPLTILQVADGKTWIVTDANEFNSKPLFGYPSTNLAQVPKGASDAKAH